MVPVLWSNLIRHIKNSEVQCSGAHQRVEIAPESVFGGDPFAREARTIGKTESSGVDRFQRHMIGPQELH
jgi:hypothetical protein